MNQYGFYMDSDGCSGCGACVLACKDKNNTPSGVFWRRLTEREGGGYRPLGQGFLTDVFAYYISLSCNHCQNPPCTRACPVGALEKREEDGLVNLDNELCIGCGECVPACPFGALHLDSQSEKACKCDGCLDLFEINESPACVAACPLRVLDFGPLDELHIRYPQAVPYGHLEPASGGSAPSLLVKPHRRFVKTF